MLVLKGFTRRLVVKNRMIPLPFHLPEQGALAAKRAAELLAPFEVER